MKRAVGSRLLGAGLLALMLSLRALSARDDIYQPKPGSSQRRAIFDALRVPVRKSLGKPVVFQGTLKASRSGWAFFSGSALWSNGKPISDEGSGGAMVALLRASKGKWRVLSWGFGGGMDATDEAMKKYPQAPRALFR